MGRETKILLALLATLSGVFLGVLSMKLLVPRPPAGAGPDVHTEVAAARPIEIVEPPALDPSTPLRSRFATPSADEIAAVDRPATRFSVSPAEPAAERPAAPPAGRPAGQAPAPSGGHAPGGRDNAITDAVADAGADAPAARVTPRRDPFVTRAAFDAAPANLAIASPTVPETEPAAATPAERSGGDAPRYAPAIPGDAAPPAPSSRGTPAGRAEPSPMAGYECMPGDSWWSLAERAYGDGRLYRALFAWNRTIDPRVSLAPGTRLELPPRERLEAAWPKLVPTAPLN